MVEFPGSVHVSVAWPGAAVAASPAGAAGAASAPLTLCPAALTMRCLPIVMVGWPPQAQKRSRSLSALGPMLIPSLSTSAVWTV